MPDRSLGYQVGGHNSVSPNLVALSVAGFKDMVHGPLRQINEGVQPYVDQIVRTTNSILDERDRVGEMDSALKHDDPIKPIFEMAFAEFEPHWRDHVTVDFVDVTNRQQLVNTRQFLEFWTPC